MRPLLALVALLLACVPAAGALPASADAYLLDGGVTTAIAGACSGAAATTLALTLEGDRGTLSFASPTGCGSPVQAFALQYVSTDACGVAHYTATGSAGVGAFEFRPPWDVIFGGGCGDVSVASCAVGALVVEGTLAVHADGEECTRLV